jgi:putative phosphoribosyl transferase
MMSFRDRTEAGEELAREFEAYADRDDVLVLALPRGGVPVAFEVAKALRAPLDVWLVRKLGVPGHSELAMGAITAGGICVLNEDVVQDLRIPNSMIAEVARRESQELERRARVYRGDRPALLIGGQNVILVDDGVATGATLRAAIAALRTQEPARLIVAVPVASSEACVWLEEQVDELICLLRPADFWSVGSWYIDFSPTTDEDVCRLLNTAREFLEV